MNDSFFGDEDSDLKDKFDDSESFSSGSSCTPIDYEMKFKKKYPLMNIDFKKIEKNDEVVEYNDLIKCYICLQPSQNPVICRYCGNIACKTCFYKWVETHHKCGCCRKNISKHELISPPIIGKINGFLKHIDEKNKENQCILHQEKILYFCANCIKEFCGKCLFFNSEESKNHTGHKILEYSKIKKSNYKDLINKLNKSKEIINDINVNSKIYDNYKLDNKIKYNIAMNTLDFFKKIITKKFNEKNQTIAKNTDKLNNIKEEINNNCQFISKNLQKIEEIEKPLENFNIEKNHKNLKKGIENVEDIKKVIENTHCMYNELEFKTIHFSIEQQYKDIINNKKNKIEKNLIYIEIMVEDNENICITIPNNYVEKKTKKTFYLFPMLMLNNNKLYEFNIFKIKDINNSMDSDEENKKINNITNCVDDSFNYKAFIKINELNQTGENKFYFSFYIFSVY